MVKGQFCKFETLVEWRRESNRRRARSRAMVTERKKLTPRKEKAKSPAKHKSPGKLKSPTKNQSEKLKSPAKNQAEKMKSPSKPAEKMTSPAKQSGNGCSAKQGHDVPEAVAPEKQAQNDAGTSGKRWWDTELPPNHVAMKTPHYCILNRAIIFQCCCC
ncbi:hypothetical protein OROGR_020732 [Orobanche gracilis]